MTAGLARHDIVMPERKETANCVFTCVQNAATMQSCPTRLSAKLRSKGRGAEGLMPMCNGNSVAQSRQTARRSGLM